MPITFLIFVSVNMFFPKITNDKLYIALDEIEKKSSQEQMKIIKQEVSEQMKEFQKEVGKYQKPDSKDKVE